MSKYDEKEIQIINKSSSQNRYIIFLEFYFILRYLVVLLGYTMGEDNHTK